MAQTNPNLINGGVEMKDGPKKERLWTVPAISLAIAAIIISLILFRDSIGGWFSGGFDEPYTRWDEDTVEQKMEDNETFALFLYGEDCPHCKNFMFGDPEAKSGEGPLTTWVENDYDHDFGAFWTEEGDGFEGIEDYLANLEDSIATNENISSEKFKWRDRLWVAADNANGSFDSTKTRPGVPSIMFFVDGYLQTVMEGAHDRSDMLEMQIKIDDGEINSVTHP